MKYDLQFYSFESVVFGLADCFQSVQSSCNIAFSLESLSFGNFESVNEMSFGLGNALYVTFFVAEFVSPFD